MGAPPVGGVAGGAAPPRPEADHLVWRSTTVQGRRATYGVAGDGAPVLFLHGWALGQHAYKRALKRLVRLGCRVYAPSLPGFGATADLPGGRVDLTGYARWVAGFLQAVGEVDPVTCIGHSFGGAVATQLAHDHPDRVGHLVLVNAVGGRTWVQAGSRVRSMAERPLWHWGLWFSTDLLVLRGAAGLVSSILEDAVPNLLTNPVAVLRAGQLARRADLTAELRVLRQRRLPVVVLWGDKDTVVPRASFEAICAALGSEGEVVKGRHSWLLADPDAFGEVMRTRLPAALAPLTAIPDLPAAAGS